MLRVMLFKSPHEAEARLQKKLPARRLSSSSHSQKEYKMVVLPVPAIPFIQNTLLPSGSFTHVLRSSKICSRVEAVHPRRFTAVEYAELYLASSTGESVLSNIA